MKVVFLFGFLGAGKTTLLRRILSAPPPEGGLAVIVNEFGDVGIDGTLLEDQAENMVELPSGCVCCELQGPLVEALEDLQEDYDHVIVEASGVAQPGALVAALADTVTLAPLVTVVDAARFARLIAGLGPFYREQVANADLVVLNKTDLATPEQLAGALAAIAEISPEATVIPADHGDIDGAPLFEGESRRSGSHGSHVHADALTLTCETPIDGDALRRAFATLPCPLWRAKGFADIDGVPSLIQYVPDRLEITPADGPHRHLVLIGPDLDREALAAHFAFAHPTPKP
ncbi:MAG: GTP-binding protein [Alphaproteobacteria bacterium]|nr:GTP-binding protein [Alphaproteobacteria bacterium]